MLCYLIHQRLLMAKIPDRFLGFSFAVGDILLEVDNSFLIINADGSISEIGIDHSHIKKSSFIDFISEEGRADFAKISSSLKSSNRVGPIQFNIGLNDNLRKKYSLFINRLPGDNDRLFIVLISSYRMGPPLENKNGASSTQVKEEAASLLRNVEDILTENKGKNKKLNITLLETDHNIDPRSKNLHDIDHLLKKYSAGGNLAGRLNNNSYAVVHEKSAGGVQTDDLLRELTKSTGLNLKSTTIDADQDFLSEEDGVRSLIFSLQQFADRSEGFDIETFTTSYTEIIGDTSQKVKNLRKILMEGRFSIVFQPIIHLKTKEIHHSEALVRFNDPELLDKQFETICFAEKVGLIQEFDTAIYHRVVEKIEQIMEHETPPNIAVNMSGRSLSDPKFLENLKARLTQHIHLNEFISLEIKESSEIKNLKLLSTIIDEVRSMGFKVYLDDFGAGAAGFQYLKELTVDGVKIDGEYVRDALVNKKTRAFLKSFALLCNDLNIETIAEWVETEEQAELLKSLNVTYGQGYLYGRPNNGLKTNLKALKTA